MTVSVTVPLSGPHVADGVNRDWQFTWKTFTASDLRLRITDADGSNPVDVAAGFTVDPAYLNNSAGGYARYPISPTAALTAGKLVWVYRAMPYSQPTRIGNQGAYKPETHETGLDTLAMQIQQLNERMNRALTYSIGSALAGTTQEFPTPAANLILGWTASAPFKLENKTTAGLPNEVLPAVANTFPVRNAGNTAYDAKTDKQVRKILLSAPYVATKDIMKGLDVTTDDLAYDMQTGSFYHRKLLADPYFDGLTYNDIWTIDQADGALRKSTFNALHAWVHEDIILRRAMKSEWWGARGDGALSATDLYNLIVVGEALMRTLKLGYQFSKGTHDIGDRNYPFRNPSGVGLLDYYGVSVFGHGRETIIQTSSADGADVFQLNAVKNLELRDMSITAILTSWDKSGSNGCSITNGYDGVVLRRLHFFNMPGTDAQFGTDGGKGPTIQPGTSANRNGSLRIEDCTVDGALYGIGADVDATTMDDKDNVVIVRNLIARRCYQGAVVSAGAPSAGVPAGLDFGLNFDLTSVDCQRDIWLARGYGGKYAVQLKSDPLLTVKDKALNHIRGTYVEALAAAAVATVSNRFTVAANVDKFTNGAIARVTSSGVLPAPLAAATDYWVIRDFERILASQIDIGTDIITVISNTNRWETGDGVQYEVFSGSLPGGITAGVTYFLRRVSATQITLHPTNADALANTNIINLTTTGSGVFSMIGALATTTFRLASTLANAIAGTPIDITTQGTGNHTFTLQYYWRHQDTDVEGVLMSYQRGGIVTAVGDKGACHVKVRMGGALAGVAGHPGRTENVKALFDIGGTAATADFVEEVSGGNSANNNDITVTPRTVSRANFPSALKGKGNRINYMDGADDAITVIPYAASVTPNFLTDGMNLQINFGAGNVAIQNPAGIADVVGRVGSFTFVQDGVGGRTVAIGSQWDVAGGGGALVIGAGANAVSVFHFRVVSPTSVVFLPGALSVA